MRTGVCPDDVDKTSSRAGRQHERCTVNDQPADFTARQLASVVSKNNETARTSSATGYRLAVLLFKTSLANIPPNRGRQMGKYDRTIFFRSLHFIRMYAVNIPSGGQGEASSLAYEQQPTNALRDSRVSKICCITPSPQTELGGA